MSKVKKYDLYEVMSGFRSIGRKIKDVEALLGFANGYIGKAADKKFNMPDFKLKKLNKLYEFEVLKIIHVDNKLLKGGTNYPKLDEDAPPIVIQKKQELDEMLAAQIINIKNKPRPTFISRQVWDKAIQKEINELLEQHL